MTLFPVATISLFWKHQLGMSMADIMLLQSAFAITMVVMEFPTGYLGDWLGYRRSLMGGFFICTVGWILYTKAQSFYGALVCEIVLGLGLAFISGSDVALLYESLRSLGQLEASPSWHSRLLGFAQCGEALAALSAGFIYILNPKLSFYLQSLIFLGGASFAFFLKEPVREQEKRSHLRFLQSIMKEALFSSPKLRYTLLLSCLFGLASYFPVWIIQLHSEQEGLPQKWLGVSWAAANLLVALGAGLGPRFFSKFSLVPTLVISLALIVTGYSGLAFWSGVSSFLFYYFITFARGINIPLLTSTIQGQISSSMRASILSLRSVLIRFTFALTAPLMGSYMDQTSYQQGFLVIGMTLTLGLLLTLGLAYRSGLR